MHLDSQTGAIVAAIGLQSLVFAAWLGSLSTRVKTVERDVLPLVGLRIEVGRLQEFNDAREAAPRRRSAPRRKASHAPFDTHAG